MSLRHFLIDDLRDIPRRWSIWSAAMTVVALVAVPVIDDHWPDATQVIVALFPKHGAVIAAGIGIVVSIAAQCIKQKAVLDALRGIFKKGGDHDAA